MKDEDDKESQNQDNSNIISFDEGRGKHKSDTDPETHAANVPDQLEQQYSFEDDEDTRSLLESLERGELTPLDPDIDGDEPGSLLENNELPVTPAEQSAEIESMVEAMAGDEQDDSSKDQDEDEDEDEEEKLDLEAENAEQKVGSQSSLQSVELPNMEIAAEKGSVAENEVNAKEPISSSDSENADTDKIPWNDLRNEPVIDRDARSAEELQALQRQQQPMVQTNLAGGLGQALGAVLNAVFTTVGLALGSGVAVAKQTKDAISRGTGDSSAGKAGASKYFSPAAKAVNDSFNEDVARQWKLNRIDSEFSGLQTDMDKHLRSFDRLKQTEWARKLVSIEQSGDPELMAKAPTILNLAKAQIDFKDASGDLSYFQDHIKQRAERLSSMVKDSQVGSENLENAMIKWQEDAKKRLEDLPVTKETQGMLERVQNVAQNAIAGLRSMFSKSAKIG